MKTDYQKITDELTDGCGCACHTGMGYKTGCSHCQMTTPKPSWEIKKRKVVCPACNKEVFKLGFSSHWAKHERQDVADNKPKYSERQLREALSDQRKESYREGVKAVKLPIYDHSKCPIPASCIGYQNAESDLENIKENLLKGLNKKGEE